MNALPQMINEYKEKKDSLSDKEKAEFEERLWNAYLRSDMCERGAEKRKWLKDILNGHQADYEMRSSLWRAGEWVDPFWNLLQNGESMWTVTRLFRETKKLVFEGNMPREPAIKYVINSYESTGYQVESHGKKYRRRTSAERVKLNPELAPNSIPFRGLSNQNTKSKQFTLRLIALAKEYVSSSIEGVLPIDDPEALKVTEDFIAIVQEAGEDLRRRVYDVKSQSKQSSKPRKIGREQVRQACEVLGLSMTSGQNINLKAAKKAMLRRASQLHPDRNNNSNQTQLEYQAVVEAYKTLELFMEGMKSNESGASHEVR